MMTNLILYFEQNELQVLGYKEGHKIACWFGSFKADQIIVQIGLPGSLLILPQEEENSLSKRRC